MIFYNQVWAMRRYPDYRVKMMDHSPGNNHHFLNAQRVGFISLTDDSTVRPKSKSEVLWRTNHLLSIPSPISNS